MDSEVVSEIILVGCALVFMGLTVYGAVRLIIDMLF